MIAMPRALALLAILLPHLLFPISAHGSGDDNWWDGFAPYPEGQGMSVGGRVNSMTSYNGWLVAMGEFPQAGGTPANNIAGWDGAVWHALEGGLEGVGVCSTVYQGDLIAGGDFTEAGGTSANNIAKWDGAAWDALGLGTNHVVESLAVYNGKLIAGGNFTEAGGIPANCIAQWDGVSWSSVGSGIVGGDGSTNVYALTVFAGKLIAAGHFTQAGGTPADNIAQWDGSAWSALGGGLPGDPPGGAYIYALTVHDGKLIAGGLYSTPFPPPIDALVGSWDGTSWAQIGQGLGGCRTNDNGIVSALTVHHGELIAGGRFLLSPWLYYCPYPGPDQKSIARWDGASWRTLGTGLRGVPIDCLGANCLSEYNGSLYVGGRFSHAGCKPSSNIAQWDDDPLLQCPIIGHVDTSGVATDVAIAGTHAFVAAGSSGLAVIDVSDPGGPMIVGGVDTPYHAYGVEVVEPHAYVADGESGFQVIDISNPAAPQGVGGVDTGFALDVAVAGSHAYVCGHTGLAVVNISNPSTPMIVATISGQGLGNYIAVSGSFVYVTWEDFFPGPWYLDVIDVSNPTEPQRVGRLQLPSTGTGVAVSGPYVYVGQGNSGPGSSGLYVIDVLDPSAPRVAGSAETQQGAFRVAVSGNHAYVATGNGGSQRGELEVFEVIDPAAPCFAGGTKVPKGSLVAYGVAVAGNHAYLVNVRGDAISSDISVITLPCETGILSLRGTVRDEHNGAPIEGAVVTLSGAEVRTGTITGPEGKYGFCNLQPGTYTVTASRADGFYASGTTPPVEIPRPGDVDVEMESKVVVLVHGLCGYAGDWQSWYQPLQTAGFRAFSIALEPHADRFWYLSYTLEQEINRLMALSDFHSFQIVAHSMGGLVSRAYITRNPDRVPRLVMLGTPNHGSEWASILHPLIESPRIFRELATAFFASLPQCSPDHTPWAVDDLRSGSYALNYLNYGIYEEGLRSDCTPSHSELRSAGDETEYWIIAGDCNSGLRDFTTGWGLGFGEPFCRNDGTVTVESTRIDFAHRCVASDAWDCEVHHFDGGCEGIKENSCVRAKVLELLGGLGLGVCTAPQMGEGVRQPGSPLETNLSIGERGLLYSSVAALEPSVPHADSIWVAIGDRAAFTSVSYEPPDQFYLIDPVGVVIDSVTAESRPDVTFVSGEGVAGFQVTNPIVGLWQAVTVLGGSLMADRLTLAYEDGAATISNLTQGQIDLGETLQVLVRFSDATGPVLEADATAQITPQGEAPTTLELFDDGLHGDRDQNDGVYGNTTKTTVIPGTYLMSFAAFSNEGLPRTARAVASVLVETLPDPAILAGDVHLSNPSPVVGDTVTVSATVRNLGGGDADSVLVSVSDNGLGAVFFSAVVQLPLGSSEILEAQWFANGPPYDHEIAVHLVALSDPLEVSLQNNLATVAVLVGAPIGIQDATPSPQPTESMRPITVSNNRPNPFNPSTTIAFSLHQGQKVTISVYDTMGRVVARPFDQFAEPGEYEVFWDARTQDRKELRSGVYFYQIETPGGKVTGKMVLIK